MESIINFLFPGENCLFCREDKSIYSKYICSSCMELVEFTNEEVDLKFSFMEKAYYSVLYNKFIREKFHNFKFGGKSYLYKAFGEMLLDTIKINNIEYRIDSITFVPIHRRKKAIRGYNQSELLGKYVSKVLNIPLLDKHLVKARYTVEQNKLGKLERRENLRNSFKTINQGDFKGKEILLIDDIITTGTTMEECANVLLAGGAKKVYGLTLTSSTKF